MRAANKVIYEEKTQHGKSIKENILRRQKNACKNAFKYLYVHFHFPSVLSGKLYKHHQQITAQMVHAIMVHLTRNYH